MASLYLTIISGTVVLLKDPIKNLLWWQEVSRFATRSTPTKQQTRGEASETWRAFHATQLNRLPKCLVNIEKSRRALFQRRIQVDLLINCIREAEGMKI